MRSGLTTACLSTDGKEPDSRLSITIPIRVGRRSSKQPRKSEVGMGSTEQVAGLDLRITLLSSCSDTGRNDSKTEDKHKSGHTTGEKEVCWSRSEHISVTLRVK